MTIINSFSYIGSNLLDLLRGSIVYVVIIVGLLIALYLKQRNDRDE